MNRFLAAHFAAGNFDGAVGDDFVDVHVGLRAAAGLPDAKREVLVEFSGDDFVGGPGNEAALFVREFAEVLVNKCGGLLGEPEGRIKPGGIAVLAMAKREDGGGGRSA